MKFFQLLKTDEMKTTEKANDEFKVETDFAQEELDLFLRTFQILSETDVEGFNHSKDSAYRISYRILRVTRCAFNCALQGYYDVSMALLRIAYENHLLMNYLSKREDEARKWFNGEQYSARLLKENVSYADNALYKTMCEFIHSSFRSTLWFTEIRGDKTKAVVGEYDRAKFDYVITLILMTLTTTMILLSLTFPSELVRNEDWHPRFKSVIPRIWKYLKKHSSKS